MGSLRNHYARLLELDDAWEVSDVGFSVEEHRVESRLKSVGGRVQCPKCGQACGIADHAEERRRRLLPRRKPLFLKTLFWTRLTAARMDHDTKPFLLRHQAAEKKKAARTTVKQFYRWQRNASTAASSWTAQRIRLAKQCLRPRGILLTFFVPIISWTVTSKF